MRASRISIGLIMAAMSLASVAFAAVPHLINYQGKLMDSSGNPVPDDTYSITFGIYDAATGGSKLWEETQSVAVATGVFGVLLPIDLPFDVDYWLERAVGGETIGRIRMVSVGYSYRAENADAASLAADIADGVVTTVKIAADAVTSAKILDGTIQQSDLSFTPSGDGHSLDAADGSPVDALYVDNEGEIGIGTTSPAQKLDVAGTAQMTGFRMSTGAADGYVLTADASGVGTWQASGTGTGTGDITAVVAGNGLTGVNEPGPGEATLHVGAGTGVAVSADAVSLTSSYVDGSAHDARFVNEGQASSVDGSMITNGTIASADIGSSYDLLTSSEGSGLTGGGSTSLHTHSNINNVVGDLSASGHIHGGSMSATGTVEANVVQTGTVGWIKTGSPTSTYGIGDVAADDDLVADDDVIAGDAVTAGGVATAFRFYAANAGDNNAITVKNQANTYPTIWGENLGSGTGVYGKTASGAAIYGDNLGGGAGVYGTSVTGIGVRGLGNVKVDNAGYIAPAVFAKNSHYEGIGIVGLGANTSSYQYMDGAGVVGSGATGVFGYTTTSGGVGVYGKHDGSGYGVYFSGQFGGSGTKSAIVRVSEGPVALYCQESPECWFEDFGSDQLVNGAIHIELDPVFLQTVTIDDQNPMKVFIQLTAECSGVYVTKGQTGFDVRELNGGASSATFDYRVVAKRKGYEDRRLDTAPVAYQDPFLYPESANPAMTGVNSQEANEEATTGE